MMDVLEQRENLQPKDLLAALEHKAERAVEMLREMMDIYTFDHGLLNARMDDPMSMANIQVQNPWAGSASGNALTTGLLGTPVVTPNV